MERLIDQDENGIVTFVEGDRRRVLLPGEDLRTVEAEFFKLVTAGETAGSVEILAAAAAPGEALPPAKRRLWWPFNKG